MLLARVSAGLRRRDARAAGWAPSPSLRFAASRAARIFAARPTFCWRCLARRASRLARRSTTFWLKFDNEPGTDGGLTAASVFHFLTFALHRAAGGTRGILGFVDRFTSRVLGL